MGVRSVTAEQLGLQKPPTVSVCITEVEASLKAPSTLVELQSLPREKCEHHLKQFEPTTATTSSNSSPATC